MLRESLIEATQFFSHEVLGSEVSLFDYSPTHSAYAAMIDVNGDVNATVTVYINKKSLTRMAFLFLFEENPDEKALEDLIKEIANLIVGKAKVIAQEKSLAFDIGTPEFLAQDAVLQPNDFEVNFMFEEEIFTLTAKVNG